MNNFISYAGFLIAIFLPWLMGTTWLRFFFRHSNNWNWSFILGYGYFIGIFFTAFFIHFWSSIGIQPGFFTLSGIIAIITLAGHFALLQSSNITQSANSIIVGYRTAHHWQKLVVGLLIALIIVRCGTILLEVIWRPLYPWDAWMNWTIKAKTWFLAGGISDYTSPSAWLTQPESPNAYTLGNWKAWKYPETIPLIQYWTALGIGYWNDSLINLPWVVCIISFGLAFYGQARLQNIGVLPATIGAYLVMNLPYINVHTALAGYADIWLMATFSLSALSLSNWKDTQDIRHLYIAILLALVCSLLKMPGIIFTAVLVLALIIDLSKNVKLLVTISALIAILVTIIITKGVYIDIAGVGKLIINSQKISIPILGEYLVKYYPTWNPIKRTLFFSSNWNILYLLLTVLIISPIALKYRPHRSKLIPIILMVLIALYFFLFFFTRYHYLALDQTTLNRVIIYSIPIFLWHFVHASKNVLRSSVVAP